MTTMTTLDVERIRKDFPVLQREVNGKPLVYLDNAATSQKPQAMIDRMVQIYSQEYARVEEGHTLSKEATEAYEGTRSQVARLINAAESREIIFCRGATEALNLVANGFGRGVLEKGDEVLLTQAEHHSNIVPWLQNCENEGAHVRVVPIDDDGEMDLEAYEELLTDKVKVASISHVSNVTGAVYPVRRMTELAHKRGIQVVVDGAQAVPHMPVDVQEIGCDYYAGSGHKMGGPSSVGFLYGKAKRLESLDPGDGGSTMSEMVSLDPPRYKAKPLPHKFEAGEPAFSEVEAWSAALDYWMELGLDRIAEYEEELARYAAEQLAAIDGVRVLGRPQRRLSIVSFTVKGRKASDVEKALDAEGIAVRAGQLAAQPMLERLGTKEAVRASFNFYNTHAEADALAAALRKIAR